MKGVETEMKNLNQKVDDGFNEIKGAIKELSNKVDQAHSNNDERFTARTEFMKEIERINAAIGKRLWQSNLLTAAATALIISLVWYIVLQNIAK